MGKRGALNSIAHNIAHHAASGLSYIQPYAGQASRSKKLSPLTLDLLADDPLNGLVAAEDPLGLSSRSIQKKFLGIVSKEGIKSEWIKSAIWEFLFPTEDNYYTVCTCRLIDSDGMVHSMIVSSA